MTYKQTVGNRLNNHDHHIHDFEDRTELIQIWIGTIANKKAKESDVRICEKMITSQLASEAGVGKGNLENKILLSGKTPKALNTIPEAQ